MRYDVEQGRWSMKCRNNRDILNKGDLSEDSNFKCNGGVLHCV